MIHLDCTPRDGGYYNAWNFSQEVIEDYLESMLAVGVNTVELGLRSLINKGFKGPNAYTTDAYLRSLKVPNGLTLAVMINAAELVGVGDLASTLRRLFPEGASTSPVKLVRVACHIHEFPAALPAANWLKEQGFIVGFNLMQIADRTEAEVIELAKIASAYPLDVLYFADSMGSMKPAEVGRIIGWLKTHWKGALGIHTHDNLGLALSNTLQAIDDGVTWVDSTITGMGRGPGNALTEQLCIELAERSGKKINLTPLMSLIARVFKPMQAECGWGTNPYYYLAGKYGIHPTYIQEMLQDSRYCEVDILSVIDHLRVEGGKKFSLNTLDAARHFYQGEPRGQWHPSELFKGREVLLLGSGPGVAAHKAALEAYIQREKPIVLALNTQSSLDQELIDVRVACHPTRLLADCEAHQSLPQPLIAPASMLPDDVRTALSHKSLLDFGMGVQDARFEFNANYCVIPSSIVVVYALAVLTSGGAKRVLMAGFDGYSADDPRSKEMDRLLNAYLAEPSAVDLVAITPTRYPLPSISVYAL